MSNCTSPIIVALDFPNADAAMACVKQLEPTQCRLKIGKELFVRAGPDFVETVQSLGFDVFLDLKFHDIPNTVAGAVRSAADLGVWMLTVHASGGEAMLRAAMTAAKAAAKPPIVVAVTLLTSLDPQAVQQIGYPWADTTQGVMHLATLAKDAGVDGLVCSAQEVQAVKTQLGSSLICVTPGIRPADAAKDDQQRVMTPSLALTAGSDYLVIGRPITQAENPLYALEKIILDINA